MTLEQVLANGIYNDLGFVVGDRMIILAEAQSTWSDNIVIRELMYLMSTYQAYINRKEINLYSTAPARLPVPELYMIYTKEQGTHPPTISLRDRLFPGQPCPIDATVQVLYLDDSASIISQYIGFCLVFDEQKKLYGYTMQAVQETIRICIDRNLLRDYLESRRPEVEDIMFTLFDQEKITKMVIRDAVNEAVTEAREDERSRNFAQMALNMLREKMSIDMISRLTTLPAEQIKKLAADNGLAIV